MAIVAIGLAACSSTQKREPASTPGPVATPPKSGGYYKDDGPGDNPPANLDTIPEAVPKLEPLSRFSNRPYSVFGVDYVPATTLRPYKERGIASWYGRKFHARVTNVATGKSVVVRVNDRGPFHPGRVIDLSYAAAYRIGIAQKGSGQVEVESILPGDAPPQVAVTPLPPLAVAEAASVTAMPLRQEPGGYVVQLGAFGNNANAQVFIANIANQVAPLGVEAKVHEGNGLFRVSVGPYSTRDEARRVAERLREALGLDGTVRAQ
jgi:rare lipoprotein A